MKKQLKQIIKPEHLSTVRGLWHGFRAMFMATSLLFPATKMKIIGITGTKGKTTTTVFLGRLLNALGVKTGYISTALIYLGTAGEDENPFKMTTIDPVQLQKYLKTMQYVGCKVVVLEMSSQGLQSNRHLGLFGFDYTVFLNLFPEHLDAHGSLENYVNAKAILFENLRRGGTAIVNGEFETSQHMLSSIPESVAKTAKTLMLYPSKEYTTSLNEDKYTLQLEYEGMPYSTDLFSQVEVLDFYWAARVAELVLTDLGHDIPLETILKKSSEAGHVAGRMEFAAHEKFADALLDYAHEPESIEQLLKMLAGWRERGLYNNIIHIVSSDGAGRDDWKKEVMGALSYQYADYTYLTTDNYDASDDPEAIIDLLGKKLPSEELNKKYYRSVNRLDAMKNAFSKTKILKGRTLIVSTGVGNEHGLTQPNGVLDWNEKDRWQEVFSSLGTQR